MNNQLSEFTRTESLFGHGKFEKIQNAYIAVFGIGGVGGYVVEALVRSGIQKIDIIDNDTVSLTNINRQIIALQSTVGKHKAEVMKERILDINPNAEVYALNIYFNSETVNTIDFSQFDYIVDAVDDIKAKVLLAKLADENKIPIIAAMGAGNKTDPTKFEVSDIFKTSVCPLARIMRH